MKQTKSSPTRSYLRILVITGSLFLLILIAAIAFLIFVALRVQHTLNQAPVYTSKELYNSALDQVSKGDYPTAESYLEQALLKQDDPSYRNQLAVVEYHLKKYSAAIAQYQQLIKAGQDVAFAWNGIGNAERDFAEQENKEQHQANALTAYQNAIQADPHYSAAYSNAALLLMSQGQKEQALRLLSQGITYTQSQQLAQIKASLESQN